MGILKTRVIRLSVASLLAGLAIGYVGAAFRHLLRLADLLRNAMVLRLHAWPYIGWAVPVLVAAASAALARLMVIRFAPSAEGSGIQRVEAVVAGELKPASPAVIPVKFFGGLLALGSGLALGREGPTVQMGASLARLVSKSLVQSEEDRTIVDAAGAGAGLAVAFNAPIGGSIFIAEELTSAFSPWLLVATLAAASLAVWSMRLVLGNTQEFIVPRPSYPVRIWFLTPLLTLGALQGALGALFNKTTLEFLYLSDRMSWLPSIARAALIGAAVGWVAWFAPSIVGGGDDLTQRILSGSIPLAGLTAILCIRFILAPWSYAAGVPGGIFAPLLVLGASSGAVYGTVISHFFPHAGVTPIDCAVVGMGALFAASIRAPLTGIVLSIEMTGRADLSLGLLVAALGAMVMAILLRSEPIYDSLKRRMFEQQAVIDRRPHARVQVPRDSAKPQ